MRNINPSLIHDFALTYVERKYSDELDNRYKRNRIDVRVYDLSGSGYFFIRGNGPGKWYRQDDASDDHFCNCQMSDVQRCIDAGGRVQIVGDRGRSYGVWTSWDLFTLEVLR